MYVGMCVHAYVCMYICIQTITTYTINISSDDIVYVHHANDCMYLNSSTITQHSPCSQTGACCLHAAILIYINVSCNMHN